MLLNPFSTIFLNGFVKNDQKNLQEECGPFLVTSQPNNHIISLITLQNLLNKPMMMMMKKMNDAIMRRVTFLVIRWHCLFIINVVLRNDWWSVFIGFNRGYDFVPYFLLSSLANNSPPKAIDSGQLSLLFAPGKNLDYLAAANFQCTSLYSAIFHSFFFVPSKYESNNMNLPGCPNNWYHVTMNMITGLRSFVIEISSIEFLRF